MLSFLLGAIVGGITGYYHRELSERLLRIEKGLQRLLERQKVEEQKDKKMGFAEPIPMTMDQFREAEEEARIARLNEQ